MTEALRNFKENQSAVDVAEVGLYIENDSWANYIKVFDKAHPVV